MEMFSLGGMTVSSATFYSFRFCKRIMRHSSDLSKMPVVPLYLESKDPPRPKKRQRLLVSTPNTNSVLYNNITQVEYCGMLYKRLSIQSLHIFLCWSFQTSCSSCQISAEKLKLENSFKKKRRENHIMWGGTAAVVCVLVQKSSRRRSITLRNRQRKCVICAEPEFHHILLEECE